MKNITFSADEELIERARLKARLERRTLNAAFRAWLERYAGGERPEEEIEALMRRLDYAQAGRKFSRHEMNDRSVSLA